MTKKSFGFSPTYVPSVGCDILCQQHRNPQIVLTNTFTHTYCILMTYECAFKQLFWDCLYIVRTMPQENTQLFFSAGQKKWIKIQQPQNKCFVQKTVSDPYPASHANAGKMLLYLDVSLSSTLITDELIWIYLDNSGLIYIYIL